MNKTHDDLEIYCPHLGMMLTFAYCRCSQSPLPCRNFVNCWENRMAVWTYLSDHYSHEDLELAFGGLPKTKLERIFDCLKELKETVREGF